MQEALTVSTVTEGQPMALEGTIRFGNKEKYH